jgi:ABC-type oligopeptide transport system substrate-binding subunit
MWKQNLNLDTEVIVLGSAEFENARAFGDYDLIRRGAVFPSNDEAVSLASIFSSPAEPPPAGDKAAAARPDTDRQVRDNRAAGEPAAGEEKPAEVPPAALTEQEAIEELRAIPLYFPTSYSLVKPYVSGFDFNSLDAPSLKDVSIDNSWQPK